MLNIIQIYYQRRIKLSKDIHIEIFKYLKQFIEPYYNNNEIKKSIITFPSESLINKI